MKTIVITIQDDVCAKNGRDPNATALIEAARNFGKVESWESAISTVAAQYQQTIDNLRIQLNALEDHNLTVEELMLLKCYRECKEEISGKYTLRINELETQLVRIKEEEQERLTKIMSILEPCY